MSDDQVRVLAFLGRFHPKAKPAASMCHIFESRQKRGRVMAVLNVLRSLERRGLVDSLFEDKPLYRFLYYLTPSGLAEVNEALPFEKRCTDCGFRTYDESAVMCRECGSSMVWDDGETVEVGP